jgi:hypothetical protein
MISAELLYVMFALVAAIVAWRCRGLKLPAMLLVLLVVAAGAGPMLRWGVFSVAKVLAAVFILVRLPLQARRLGMRQWLPTAFGVMYGLAWLLGASTINSRAILACLTYAGYGLFATTVSTMTVDRRLVGEVLLAVSLVAMVAATASISEYSTGMSVLSSRPILQMGGVRRTWGLYGDPNATGGVLAMGVVAMLSLWMLSLVPRTWLAGLVAAVCLLGTAMVFTASRTGVVGLGAGLVPLLASRRASRYRRWALIAALAALVALGPSVLTQGRPISLLADDSARGRVQNFSDSLQRFEVNPFIGSGAVDAPYYAHNNVLEVFALGGLLSLAPFLVLQIAAVRNLLLHRRQIGFFALMGLFVTMTVVGLGISWLNNVLYWLVVGLGLAWPAAATARRPAVASARGRFETGRGGLPRPAWT